MQHTIANGVYTLSFRDPSASSGEDGAGVAIVRDSWIIGSDPGGCIINGHLAQRHDSGTGPEAIFEGSIFVPPESELITGQSAGPKGLSLRVRAAAIACGSHISFLADVSGRAIDVSAIYVGPLPLATAPKGAAVRT